MHIYSQVCLGWGLETRYLLKLLVYRMFFCKTCIVYVCKHPLLYVLLEVLWVFPQKDAANHTT